MKRKVFLAGVAVFLILGMAACASFTRDAYRTLTISNQAYDTTLSVMGDLYREGKVSEAQKQAAIEIGNVYKVAHNEAIAALLMYEESGGAEANKQAYLSAASRAAGALAKLLAYCRPLIEKGGK